jgi:hypothetical protein
VGAKQQAWNDAWWRLVKAERVKEERTCREARKKLKRVKKKQR